MPGSLMAAEIAEQPEALARLLRDGSGAAADAREIIKRHRPRFVLLAARGTSDHAALYGKYLAEVRLNLPAGRRRSRSTTAGRTCAASCSSP
jgi:glucosamine--fructose-6-phosphate aminotransferase (isomerizing)